MKKVIIFFTLFSLCAPYTLSQWYRQTVPTNKNIVGIEFTDSLKGWAATNWGSTSDTSYILYTSNGGTNWVIQFRYGIAFFESMDMVDGNTGYVGGYAPFPGPGSVMFKTTDGGLNWFNLNVGISLGFSDIQFLNGDTGYICENTFINLYSTTNGGQNWMLRTNGISQHPYRLFFLNYNTGWCGADFKLYKTTDAGVNWAEISSFSESVKSIFFLNDNTGWLGQSGGKIAYTSNGGTNWSVQQPIPTVSNNINDIIFLNQTGYAALSSVYVYKTTNNGLNWGYQIDTSSPAHLTFWDTNKGWSGGFGISKTTNGGGPITYVGISIIRNTIPEIYKLHQNYPNPFNPTTTIKLDIPKLSNINLVICDVLGREIYTVANRYLTAGTYSFTWDAGDYPSGIYFYRLSAGEYSETKKMVLIK